MSSNLASASDPSGQSPGAIFDFLRLTGPLSRGEIGRRAGLSRPTVTDRVDRLLASDLVVEQAGTAERGRPPGLLAWNPAAGIVVGVDLDLASAAVTVADLLGEPLAESVVTVEADDVPARVIEAIVDSARSLLKAVDRTTDDIWGVGIGVTSPVDRGTGRLMRPAGRPGWADVSLGDLVRDHVDVPVLVDNDVRMMARGEARARWPREPADFILVKLGMGTGGAIVSEGNVVRGGRGIAGEIGHVRVTGSDVRCRCGNQGCLETVAAGWAILAKLQAAGHDVSTIDDIVELVALSDRDALTAVREAGRALGEVLAVAVNLLDPRALVLGGELAAVGEAILAGVRELVHQRATLQAGSDITIATSTLGRRAAVLGAAYAVLEVVLTPAMIDRTLEQASQAAS